MKKFKVNKTKLTELKRKVNKSSKIYGNVFLSDDTELKKYKTAVDSSSLSKEDKRLAKDVATKTTMDVHDKNKPSNKISIHTRRNIEDSIVKNVEQGSKMKKIKIKTTEGYEKKMPKQMKKKGGKYVIKSTESRASYEDRGQFTKKEKPNKKELRSERRKMKIKLKQVK